MNSTQQPLHLYVIDSSVSCGKGQMPENSFSAIGDALEAADRLSPVPESIAAELVEGKRYPSPEYDVQPVVDRKSVV